MKKFLLFLFLILLVGCEKDLNNTPTKRVEIFLSNYQSLSDEVQAKIESDIDEMGNLTTDLKKSYFDLWKRHYQGLTYEIKEEKIDGDDATVITEVEIYDYSQVLNEIDDYLENNPNLFVDENGNYSSTMFNDYRINSLKEVTDRVKYTIEFKIKKINKKWILQDLNEEEYLKLSGMYLY